jgi:hypothetical protein
MDTLALLRAKVSARSVLFLARDSRLRVEVGQSLIHPVDIDADAMSEGIAHQGLAGEGAITVQRTAK